ncbi:MAG: peptidase C45 acyl-coenzyme A:6-aminopenicillanic acid acyl-transferase, partial [Planctomycetaceae bacterium]|nr:peptidase C45 acyl-coenzyme A:6-aminopenicillanic acid acyl-transferase [Planctomycetaceae bacterium]
MQRIAFLFTPVVVLLQSVLLISGAAEAAENDIADLVAASRPYLELVAGRQEKFELTAEIHVPIDGRQQRIDASLIRYDDESFDMRLVHSEYAITIRRRVDITTAELPVHGTAFVGRGPITGTDTLQPRDLTVRLMSGDSDLGMARAFLTALATGDIDAIAATLLQQLPSQYDPENHCWKLGNKLTVRNADQNSLLVESDKVTVRLSVRTGDEIGSAGAIDIPQTYRVTEISRSELEQTFSRGLRRATEILHPSAALQNPRQQPRTVEHGRLQWIEGQRVATLWGTPEEIGTAHGQLLRAEAVRCIESVLYTFGTAHVIRTGRWFRHDLDAAYARLSPHIPERHKTETRALAAALELDADQVEALNVFPELFHCSGFAVFGTATKDGTLYHGRVLDYMTTIGLQDACVTLIVRPNDHLAFANVGYAGFIGSVSGMNSAAVSLGEMGGRGEGNWDGVPMATLMRRALEECSTLQEVKSLWSNNPRTCEYYYV